MPSAAAIATTTPVAVPGPGLGQDIGQESQLQGRLLLFLGGRCTAVDREFEYILFACMFFCDFLASVGCLSIPFFFSWADCGLFLGPFGQSLGPLWNASACHGGRLGLPRDIW